MDGLIEYPYLCKSDSRIFRLKDLLESSHVCRYPLEYRQKKGVFAKNAEPRDRKQLSGKQDWARFQGLSSYLPGRGKDGPCFPVIIS